MNANKIMMMIWITLANTDVITVRTYTTIISFSLFRSELACKTSVVNDSSQSLFNAQKHISPIIINYSLD